MAVKAYLYIKPTLNVDSLKYHFVEYTALPFNIIGEYSNYIEPLPELIVIFADRVFVNAQDFSIHLYNYDKFKIQFPNEEHYPFLIISNDIPQKGEEKDKIAQYSVFNNSNIWFRCIDAGKLAANDFTELKDALEYFSNCNKIGLYKQETAWEYINYHLRIQKENHLGGGHKEHVFPNLYASDSIELNKDLHLYSELQGKTYFRILLIDDKLGYEPAGTQNNCCVNCNKIHKEVVKNNKQSITTIDNGYSCDSSKISGCKLRIIKELLSVKGDDKTKVYWKTDDIKAYYFKEDKICRNASIEFNEQQFHLGCESVQIIGVKSVDTAIACLNSNIKFDIILLDYLLDKKEDNSREYGVDLLSFISSKNDELSKEVRSNGGLENRFWIFPITAFSSSFLNHLHCEGIPLMDKKWYIYTPTNPIVTPKLFLRNLNDFVEMMIERSIYSEANLKNFFMRICDGFNSVWKEQKNRKDAIQIYVPFMGAEYRRFIQLYGSRLNIYRDKEVSLFAKSVWEKFYDLEKSNNDNTGIEHDNTTCEGNIFNRISKRVSKYIVTGLNYLIKKFETEKITKEAVENKAELITLHFSMRKFLYASTYLTDDRDGTTKLWEAWDDFSGRFKNFFDSIIDEKEKEAFESFSHCFPKVMNKINEQRRKKH